MKFFPLLVAAAGATYAADPDDAMSQLSAIMAGSQRVLGKAQRHQQKVIDRERKVVESNFNNESELVGERIVAFALDQAEAEQVLQAAIDSGIAGLKDAQKAPTKPGVMAWEDPGLEEQSKLSAKLNSANRTLQHMHRAHNRAVQEAEDDASQVFEDESMKLSMKVGDLSEDSDNAKKHLLAAVDKVKARSLAKRTELFVAHGKDQQTLLQGYEHELDNSRLKSAKMSESAKTTVDSFLGKSKKDVEIASSKVLDDLAKAEKSEIAKVLNHQPTLAPVTKNKAQTGGHPNRPKQSSPEPIATTPKMQKGSLGSQAKKH